VQQGGVVGTKKEKVFLQPGNIAADFPADVIGARPGVITGCGAGTERIGVGDKLVCPELAVAEVVNVLGCRHAPSGSSEKAHRSVEGVAARLGYDLHDAAGGHAVLRLKAAGLDLHFLDETQVDAGPHRTVLAGENSQAAEGSVCDVDAVS